MPEATREILSIIGDFITPIMVIIGGGLLWWKTRAEVTSEKSENKANEAATIQGYLDAMKTVSDARAEAQDERHKMAIEKMDLEHARHVKDMQARVEAVDARTTDARAVIDKQAGVILELQDGLVQAAADREKRTQDYNKQIEILRCRINDLEAALSDMTAERDKLATELQTVRAEMARAEDQRQKDAHQVANLRQQTALYEDLLTTLTADLDAIRNDMAAKDKVSTAVIAKLSEQVDSLETRLKDLTAKYNKAVKERDDALTKAKDAQEQADTATAILAGQRVKIIDLTERLTSLEARAAEKDADAKQEAA